MFETVCLINLMNLTQTTESILSHLMTALMFETVCLIKLMNLTQTTESILSHLTSKYTLGFERLGMAGI